MKYRKRILRWLGFTENKPEPGVPVLGLFTPPFIVGYLDFANINADFVPGKRVALKLTFTGDYWYRDNPNYEKIFEASLKDHYWGGELVVYGNSQEPYQSDPIGFIARIANQLSSDLVDHLISVDVESGLNEE